MKNRLNIKPLFFLILLFMSASSFAQIKTAISVEIESGQTTKNYSGDKLESFVVEMYSVNYPNALTFTKVNNQIVITIAQEPNTLIKIGTKNKYLIQELLYDDKVIYSIEAIDFDLKNLPKNSEISNRIFNGKIESYVGKSNFENTKDYDIDKTYKLFARLSIPAYLNDVDAVFVSMADFFSQEDALMRIFLNSYAEKTQPLTTGYLTTNEVGTIEKGVVWTPKDDENGKYEIYSKGKIIKTEVQNLTEFQQTIMDYLEKNIND